MAPPDERRTASPPDVTRVFVSGGSGFVGRALLSRLVGRGDHVVGLARSDGAARTLSHLGASVVPGTVMDEAAMAHGMSGCELAFHVAGMNSHCPADPGALWRTNVEGPRAAVRAAARAGVGRVVITSSSASIGEPHGVVGTEWTPHRGTYLSLYDRSKHIGEREAFVEGQRTGVDVIAVNPSSVQGPGRSSGNGAIAIAYLNGKLPVFVNTHVSIVDIADCVEGHLRAAQRGSAGRRYVLNGASITSLEALEVVAQLSGVHERVRIVPGAVARAVGVLSEIGYRPLGRPSPVCRARIRTILHGHRYDASSSEQELGLAYTPVANTFERIIDWAVAEGLIRRPLPRRPDAIQPLAKREAGT